MHEAFRDAEQCAGAQDEPLSGARSFEEAMAAYHLARDRHVLTFYEFTNPVATLEPPPRDLARVLAAAAGNREAMDQFLRVR